MNFEFDCGTDQALQASHKHQVERDTRPSVNIGWREKNDTGASGKWVVTRS